MNTPLARDYVPFLPSYFALHSVLGGSLKLFSKATHTPDVPLTAEMGAGQSHVSKGGADYFNSLYRLKELNPWEEPGHYFI